MTTQRLQINELFQGSSNQHPSRRRPGQVESAENIRFDVANGATRRNGTDLLAALDITTSTDWYLTSFRGQYLVAISPSGIRVFDMETGDPQTVVNGVGNYGYLSTATSKADFRTAALSDTLVIANRKVSTVFDTSEDYTVSGTVTTYDRLFDDSDDADADDPVGAEDGTIFEVLEDWKETRSGYYEKGTNDDGATVWTMIPPPLDPNAIPDASTLPHRLVYDRDNDQFVYEPCPWKSRLSGTDATNPAPSWAGSKIDAIAAMQGRLVIIGNSYLTTGEVVAPRRSAFNFYDYNVDNPTDADRIDYVITDSSVGDCLYAEAVGPDLALICENAVVVYTSGNDPLTAFNGRDFSIAQLPCSRTARPGVSAGNLFVLDQNGRIAWFVYDEGLRPLGQINDHRPDILSGETVLDLYAIGQTLFVLTASGSVKVHERYVMPEGNQQSAWSELEFYEPLAFVGAYNDKLKLVCEDQTSGYSLLNYEHRQPLYFDGFSYEVCLDRREAVTGTYDASKDRTSFVHTGRAGSLEDSVVVVTTDASGQRLNQPLRPVKVQANRVWVAGNYSNGVHYLGYRYESGLELSKLWVGASDLMPLLSQINVIHREATDYAVRTTEQGETMVESDWSSNRYGVSSYGELQAETGVSKTLAMGDARETTISIYSDSAGYFMVPAIEYRVRIRGRQ